MNPSPSHNQALSNPDCHHAVGLGLPDPESDLTARRKGFQDRRREAAVALLLLLATLPEGLGLRLGVPELLTPELETESQVPSGGGGAGPFG